MEVFMDDFMVYATTFDACLENLSKVLTRCIDTNLVLNFEKCHFMVAEGIVLGHLVFVREVRSFLGHTGFYRRFIKNFSKIALPLSKLLQKDVDFNLPGVEDPTYIHTNSPSTHLGIPVRINLSWANKLKSASSRMWSHMHLKLWIRPNCVCLGQILLYLLGSKIIIFFDHATLRFLLKKSNAKPRQIQ
ncbi:Retrovirus-related Pol polyprotein from transposon 17.6, partial [Mucuna pruriens]